MPTIHQQAAALTLLPRSLAWCQARRTVQDTWTYIPYLFPVRSVDACAPEIGEADFAYEFGAIKREDTTSFANFTPYNIRDWHVRILIQEEGFSPQVAWTGIITEDEVTLDRGTEISGRQNLKAYSYAHLLDREVMGRAWIDVGGEAKEIAWIPEFNRRSTFGEDLSGNRTDGEGPDGVHLFGGEEQWTNLDIARYLCRYHAPASFTLQLAGQADVLDSLIELHEFDGDTLWEALNRLIDRKRGLGFVPILQGDSTILIWVYTVIDKPIRLATAELPANPNQTFFALPTDRPYSHLVDPIPFRTTSVQQYDRILVRGKRAWVCGTFSLRDETLEKAWSDDLESAYDDGDGSTIDSKANDHVRSKDRFAGVYCRFRVPRDWDGEAGYDDTGKLLLSSNADGTMRDDPVGPVYRRDKPATRILPFKEGFDYTANPPEGEVVEGAEPNLRAMAVWIADVTDGGVEHTKTDRLYYVDRLSELDLGSSIRSAGVRPLDNELGFELSVSPRHYFSLNEFDGEKPSLVDPEFAYTDLVATFAFELDQRPTLTIKNLSGDPSEHQRTLTIDVPAAEYWYAGPGTIVDISDNGQPEYVAEANRILRDDSKKLAAYGAFAAAWFALRRQAVSIPIKKLGLWVQLGTLLTDVRSVSFTEPVRTVVTSRTLDYVGHTSLIQTGYGALDIGAAARQDIRGRGQGKSRRRGRGR